MAEITLSTKEAKVLLRGIVDPNASDFRLGIKKSPSYQVEVHSEEYRSSQQVSRHFESFDAKNFVNYEALKIEFETLWNFLRDPIKSEMEPEKARYEMKELLENAHHYFDDRVSIRVEARDSIRTAEGEEVDIE